MTGAELMIWGLVVHLICDWPLQNDWMANNKAKRRERVIATDDRLHIDATAPGPWWDRHPAAYVHAGTHALGMLLVFDPLLALAIGVSHFLIDMRTPVEWWSKLIGQTQPQPLTEFDVSGPELEARDVVRFKLRAFDVGTEVRFWTDQVFHIAVVAVAALIGGV